MDERMVPVLWDEECFSSSIYIEMLQGIRGAAARAQREIQVYTGCEQLLKEAEGERTVIVIGYETPRLQTSLTNLTGQGKQVILAGLDGERFGSRVSSASPSRRRATAQLIQYMRACGKDRIALVACGDRSVNDLMRCETLKSYLVSQGCKDPDSHLFFYSNHVDESFEAFYPRWREFDAVICPNDYVALCLIRFCRSRGIRIPEDLYLAAFSDRTLSRYCKPSITTMAIDFGAIGNCTFQGWEFLENHRKERMQLQITTPSRLVVRQSTGCEIHDLDLDNAILFDADYQGGPFYSDPTIARVMQVENCLARCDQLSVKIIGCLLEGENYDNISEKLFISRSALNYRLKKIFASADVGSRKEFETLFGDYFTVENNL